jgi:serine/threonine protein kinase
LHDFQTLTQALEKVGHHPQIPTLIDAFEEAGQFYIAQEFIEGTDLETYLAEQGLFQAKQIRQLLAELLPVLGFLHQHQIIHGDLKPSSLIYRTAQAIAPQPKLVLVDFRSAHLIHDAASIAADPGYAAPELLKGNATYASDLYSLGITCLHLLTDISPFDLIEADLPAIADPSLKPILERLVARDLTTRFSSADAVLQAMRQRGILSQAKPIAQAPASTWKCSATLTRQPVRPSGAIHTVAISPDGQLIATGNDDHTVCLWQLDTGKLLHTLIGHTGAVKALAFAPEGRWLASGSADGSVKLWETSTWEIIHTLQHEQAIHAVVFHPNGQLLATGGTDATVRWWDVQTEVVIASLTGHRLAIAAIAYSPTTHQLATASWDGTVKVWDETTQCLLCTLTKHNRAVRAIAFNPDGSLLATAGDDKQILLWNQATYELVCHPLDHSWTITTLMFTPDGHTLVSGSWDKTLKLWHIPDGQLINALKGHTDIIQSVAVHPDRQLIASASKDGTVRLWLQDHLATAS